MKKKAYFIVLSLAVVVLSSCGKERFYSGTATIDGTTVKYLAKGEDCSLKITAEGATPSSTIFVLLTNDQSHTQQWPMIDSIKSIPHEKNIPSLNEGMNYSIFLLKNGDTIGMGQFHFNMTE